MESSLSKQKDEFLYSRFLYFTLIYKVTYSLSVLNITRNYLVMSDILLYRLSKSRKNGQNAIKSARLSRAGRFKNINQTSNIMCKARNASLP